MIQSNKSLNVIPTLCLLATLCLGLGDSFCFGQQEEASGNVLKSDQTSKHKTSIQPTQFLRVTKDKSGDPISMQTAITRYRPAKGELVVDLIGAVHIGEADYFKQLNEQFKNYDVVLYELVAPKGTRVPKGGKKKSIESPLDLVSWMQSQAQSTLGLESQLKLIDYQKENFMHADMSPQEMSKKMAERGDTALTVGLSAITEMMRQQNKAAKTGSSSGLASQLGSESLFESLGNPLKMKRMMANQFTQSGVMDAGLGKTLNQLLITDRNAAAIKVLQKEMAQGKKKIAIFYGAAHMPDFEKQLVNDFGLKKSNQAWLNAWDLTKTGGESPKTNGTTKLLFRMLDELSR